MKTDDIDGRTIDAGFPAEMLDGCRVPVGEILFQFLKTAGPVDAAGKALGFFQGLNEASPLASIIGIGVRRPPIDEMFAIGPELRNVNAVERRTAHQA
jgi:hypothetical protein